MSNEMKNEKTLSVKQACSKWVNKFAEDFRKKLAKQKHEIHQFRLGIGTLGPYTINENGTLLMDILKDLNLNP